jgi:hypothetical protein
MSELIYRFYKSIIKAWVLPSRLEALYIVIEDYKLLIRLAKVFAGL